MEIQPDDPLSFRNLLTPFSCNEDNLRITNGNYKSSKKNSDRHGYGLKIINGIAEKYNGILNVQVRGGFFAVTTTLCLDENNE